MYNWIYKNKYLIVLNINDSDNTKMFWCVQKYTKSIVKHKIITNISVIHVGDIKPTTATSQSFYCLHNLTKEWMRGFKRVYLKCKEYTRTNPLCINSQSSTLTKGVECYCLLFLSSRINVPWLQSRLFKYLGWVFVILLP